MKSFRLSKGNPLTIGAVVASPFVFWAAVKIVLALGASTQPAPPPPRTLEFQRDVCVAQAQNEPEKVNIGILPSDVDCRIAYDRAKGTP